MCVPSLVLVAPEFLSIVPCPLFAAPTFEGGFMGNKLYVGNLAFSVNDTALEELFSQVGQVQSATIIMDKISGRSKGFGFVEMSNDEEAAESIKRLNGSDMSGRALTVSEARPQAPRTTNNFSRGNFGGGGGGGNRSFGRRGY